MHCGNMACKNVLWLVRLLSAPGWALLCIACDSPTRPDPRIPPQVGQPTSLTVEPCEYEPQIAQCPLRATWGYLYSSSRIVTHEALWSSSAPSVVRLISPGVLQAIAPGTAEIDVSLNGVELRAQFRVLSEGPPWKVSTNIEYHIRVVNDDGTDLEGVLVEIIAGGNAGLRAVSNQFGRAIFRGDVVCGPITVRGTKQGYRDWVGSAILCGRAGNGNWGSEIVGPVRMIPLQ
jgi:hypothetical protein